MIKSMTGFASLTREDARAVVGVTLRAVNHRYLDVQVRAPQILGAREAALRALVQKTIARGRVELAVSLQLRQPPTVQVELNDSFLTALASALEQVRTRGVVTGHLTPGDLLRLPHALTVREKAETLEGDAADEVFRAVDATLEEALAALEGMRAHEGALLLADLEARRATLAGLIEALAGAADRGRQDLERRLALRVQDLRADPSTDPALIAQEIVRVAARSDISEEITRFRAHLVHWTALVADGEPCGRKLDFLLQEMNREINTIGSKADGRDVSELIVRAKAELEKVREQVQNVE